MNLQLELWRIVTGRPDFVYSAIVWSTRVLIVFSGMALIISIVIMWTSYIVHKRVIDRAIPEGREIQRNLRSEIKMLKAENEDLTNQVDRWRDDYRQIEGLVKAHEERRGE